ncbi:MAG: DUF1775 domain-containing protein [Gaiellales bacterium]
MRRCMLALMLSALAVFPATASAHVELSPGRVDPGSFTLFSVLSPNESSQPLTGLRLTIPAGLEVDQMADAAGFTSQAVEDQTHRIVALSWQGGSVPPDRLATFQFSASVGSTTGELRLVGVQSFADGSTKTWRSPVIDVRSTASGGDSTARALAAAALAVALGGVAAMLATVRRRT